jgi:S-adenosylmethionine-diacylglycerol 3-amino-3-carboxypropyl transferase
VTKERQLDTGHSAQGRDRLKAAVGCGSALSREGLLEHLFAWMFKGLVYPQIWEDPEIDIEALEITPQSHVVAIASGGCNILSYLIADPQRITAVDLNKTHVALCRLKLSAVTNLPGWDSFYRFFGEADEQANINAYWRFLSAALDPETRAYWEGRGSFGLGRRRISLFSRNFYRHGLLGHCIGFGHAVARLYGVDPRDVLRARSMEEQRGYFDTYLAPLFDKRMIRWVAARQVSLYGLGIPPAQYEALVGRGDMATVLRQRVERLACGFSLNDNYFAWQAFGRSYAEQAAGPLPPYLRARHFDTIRARVPRVEVLNRSFTEYLQTRPDQSLDRYVLLDAQDWMTDAQLNALWSEITRTARPGARVIFRTAAEPTLLPGRVQEETLGRWQYQAERSHELTLRDRSAIYGGFHLYIFKS